MNRFKKFVLNGLMLTAVSLVMRAVGVSFNVYISNTVGAEAMGLFTLISTVYGFGITLATSGVNLAATRLVAESLGEISSWGIKLNNGKTPQVRAVLASCVRYSLFFGFLSAFLLFFTAVPISNIILKDSRCISSLRLLAFTLPPIALSSALSGYFSAVRRVYKNALTQIIEQLIKILLCSFLLSFFFADDVESACLCVVAGGAIAELISFIFQLLCYLFENQDVVSYDRKIPPRALIGRKLRSIALPVAFSTYLRSGLLTIEHILIPWGLEKSGASRSASLAAYGTLQSMVFPIVFFPSAILSSFAGLLVPEISQAIAEKKKCDLDRIISNVFECALIFSIGTAGIMTFFSQELGSVIYPGTNAGIYIRMIAPLIPIMYLDTAVDAMLKGLGEQVYSMGVNIADSSLSVLLVFLLLPRLGIDGYIVTIYFAEILNAALSVTRLLSVSGIRPMVARRVMIPLVCIVFSCVAVKHLSFLPIFGAMSSLAELTVSILLTLFIYLSLLTLLGSLRPQKLRRGISLMRA